MHGKSSLALVGKSWQFRKSSTAARRLARVGGDFRSSEGGVQRLPAVLFKTFLSRTETSKHFCACEEGMDPSAKGARSLPASPAG